MDIKDIIKFTGLTKDEIKSIKQNKVEIVAFKRVTILLFLCRNSKQDGLFIDYQEAH